MTTNQWATELFSSIDTMDTSRFLAFLTEDCVFRFGNSPAAEGIGAIRLAVDGFFASIYASKHELREVWDVPGHVICQGQVTYTRNDRSHLALPFVNVFGIQEKLIREDLIYIDATPLFTRSL